MADLLAFLLFDLLLELVCWTALYATGAALTVMLSLGRCRPDSIVREAIWNNGLWLIRREAQLYLGAGGVCLLGLAFWLLVILGVSLF